jgi:hypothetical protein
LPSCDPGYMQPLRKMLSWPPHTRSQKQESGGSASPRPSARAQPSAPRSARRCAPEASRCAPSPGFASVRPGGSVGSKVSQSAGVAALMASP